MRLSDKEQKLLDFIATSEEKVTNELIKDKLGPNYLGALGKLLKEELIAKKKVLEEIMTKYGTKTRKVIEYYEVYAYRVNKEENTDEKNS